MASAANDKKWARQLSCVILLALVAYGGYLRIHDLGVSLYDDEINTRERALQTVGHTLETRAYPLYYLSAKVALKLGDTEMALRLPSFIAGLLSILVLYGLVRHLHSRTAGLVAAALLTFNPFHITHSNFARYYALLLLFTLLTVWALSLLLEKGRWHQWLAYTVSAFLALSSHICFAPALALLNIGAAVYLLFRRDKGSMIRRVGLVCLLACCTLLSSSFVIYKSAGLAQYLPAVLSLGSTPVAAAEENPTPEKAADSRTLFADSVWSLATVIEAHKERSRGSGASVPDPETGEARYALTYYDFMEYLKRYFWTNTPWVWTALILLGIWGVLDLVYRVPAAGVPLFFGFFGTPAALFFFVADHWYHPRYLSYTFVFALIFVAVGICVVPRLIARILTAPRSLRLWRRVAEPRPLRAITVGNVIYVLLVLGVVVPAAPLINEAYQTYPVTGYLPQGRLETNRTPERDWRNLYAFVARTAQEGDQFLFMSPDNEHGPRYADYYLSKFLPWAEEEIHSDYHFGAPTQPWMQNFATDHPMANLWSVGYIKYRASNQKEFFHQAGGVQAGFWNRNRSNGLMLYYLGAPTTNLVANGSFENSIKEEQPTGVVKDANTAYAGKSSLRVRYMEDEVADQTQWSRYATLPVSPANYRLRNNGFEAWNENRPVGWTVNQPDSVKKVSDGENTALSLAPADSPTVLLQSIPMGLAPGRALEFQMMGRSDSPNNLHLVLRYQGPGYQREHHATHPGTGTWVQLNAKVDIPADADPESISFEIWRMPSDQGEALADNVELRVHDTEGCLEPDQPYVLSMSLRTEDLRDHRGSSQRPAGHVRLRWEDATGTIGYHTLMNLHQEAGWRFRSASFVPGQDIPRDLTSLSVEVGLQNGTGTLWVDQLQLERGARPTPFTETFRLPHDEALALTDLTPFEVGAGW